MDRLLEAKLLGNLRSYHDNSYCIALCFVFCVSLIVVTNPPASTVSKDDAHSAVPAPKGSAQRY